METSAGILLYRLRPGGPQFWIAHMGGPFWARRTTQAWSVPKGLLLPGEDARAAALREFEEEMGSAAPVADYFELGTFRQPSGKRLTVFAGEADFVPEGIHSNTFELEWPRGSGRMQRYPEMDDAGWFGAAAARTRLVKGQLPVIEALLRHLGNGSADRSER